MSGKRERCGRGWAVRVVSAAMAGLVLVTALGVARVSVAASVPLAGAAGAARDAAVTMPARGDQPLDQNGEQPPSVFAPGPGQEYELAFFIAAAVLTVLVAGGFILVIWFHGRGASASDVEAAPEDIEA